MKDVADVCFCATVSSIHAFLEKEKNQRKGPHLEGDTAMERRGYQARIGIWSDLLRAIEAGFFF
jgi:hypothetical protein